MTASLVFDIIAILATLAISFLSASRGFFRELANKASYFVGLMFSLMFTKSLSAFVSKNLETVNPIIISLCSFSLIFIISALLTRGLGSALSKMMKSIHANPIDKVLGFFLGLLEAVCIITLILILLEKQNFFDFSNIFNNSYYNKYICQNLRLVFDKISK